MFKVRACLIFPLKLSYRLGVGCVAFSMLISSTICEHKGFDKEICDIDAQGLNTQMMFYQFSSPCVDVHFPVHVLSSIKFFNSVLGCPCVAILSMTD